MKFEVKYGIQDQSEETEKSFITKEYSSYPNDNRKYVNGLYQIGFIKEGKRRMTWIPFMCGKEYSHNVKWIKIYEAYTGRLIKEIQCVQ